MTALPPAISVHIVTHNSAAALPACLEALRRQEFDGYQVRVLDNASTDDTPALLNRAGVEWIASRENTGYAAAHNTLIDQTRSEYVLTLNPDVFLQPGFLGAMKQALDAAPHVGSAAGCLLRVEQSGGDPIAIDSMGVRMRRTRQQILIGSDQPLSARRRDPVPIFGPDGAAAFYRRAMLDDIRAAEGDSRVDVFDAEFFMHKEDVDVCWRAQLRGWSSLYVPDAIAHHIRSFRPGRRERVSAEMRCLGVRNRYLLMLKNDLPRLLMRDLLPILFYDAQIFAYVLLRERSSLAAYRSLWGLRSHMIAKRRWIQANRRASVDDMRKWFSA
ncbi:MAG: glycosyltransferase family 2 protein [Anaerolineae bacterium]